MGTQERGTGLRLRDPGVISPSKIGGGDLVDAFFGCGGV